VDFATPYNIAPSPVTYKKDLIAEIDAAKDADADISANSGGLLTYNKIRYGRFARDGSISRFANSHYSEKLQSCPKVQNGDFDLDGLCSELQKKAKCSGSGPVVNEKDFNNAMQKYFREDGDDPATCAKELLVEADPQPKA
jgi:AP-1-like transcription factor